MRLTTIAREEFATRYFRYRTGEHLTCLGPTGSGKTELMNGLLVPTISPEVPVVSLVMKPRDATARRWNQVLGLREVAAWPPAFSLTNRRPPGWALWPKHTFDPDVDDALLYYQFRLAMLDSYKRGNRIVLADELAGLTDLGLKKELVAMWSRGRSMGTGVWGGSQKPTHIPLHAYNQAEHLFLAYDPDKRARERYDEIGGVDPGFVRSAVMDLDKYQWLYIRRDGQKMCIVDA